MLVDAGRFSDAASAAKALMAFGIMQGLAQTAALSTGLLVVNQLSKTEYARYTLLFTVITGAGLVADSGLSSALLARGAGARENRAQLSALVIAASRVRNRAATYIWLCSIPITWIGLSQLGASHSTTLLGVLLCGASLRLGTTAAVHSRLLTLEYRRKEIQSVALRTACLRLTMNSACFAFPPLRLASIPMAINIIGVWWSGRRNAATSAHYVDKTVQVPRHVVVAVQRRFMRLLPITLLSVAHGQVVILILGTTGRSNVLANIGALSRLNQVLAVLSVLGSMVMAPIFARAGLKSASRKFAQFMAITLGVLIVAVGMAMIFSTQILSLLGEGYHDLRGELCIILIGGAIGCLVDVASSLNEARAWLSYNWVQVPLAAFTLLVGMTTLDLSSTAGAATLVSIGPLPGVIAQTLQFWAGRSEGSKRSTMAAAEAETRS